LPEKATAKSKIAAEDDIPRVQPTEETPKDTTGYVIWDKVDAKIMAGPFAEEDQAEEELPAVAQRSGNPNVADPAARLTVESVTLGAAPQPE